jgi:hypothetical protein
MNWLQRDVKRWRAPCGDGLGRALWLAAWALAIAAVVITAMSLVAGCSGGGISHETVSGNRPPSYDPDTDEWAYQYNSAEGPRLSTNGNAYGAVAEFVLRDGTRCVRHDEAQEVRCKGPSAAPWRTP